MLQNSTDPEQETQPEAETTLLCIAVLVCGLNLLEMIIKMWCEPARCNSPLCLVDDSIVFPQFKECISLSQEPKMRLGPSRLCRLAGLDRLNVGF